MPGDYAGLSTGDPLHDTLFQQASITQITSELHAAAFSPILGVLVLPKFPDDFRGPILALPGNQGSDDAGGRADGSSVPGKPDFKEKPL